MCLVAVVAVAVGDIVVAVDNVVDIVVDYDIADVDIVVVVVAVAVGVVAAVEVMVVGILVQIDLVSAGSLFLRLNLRH